ncbi:acetylcholine receptor subunit alpha-1-A-like [Penaeus monodon]|uniref:acetylcholine receptor subunit alpha-1-A-like n=1 Tax=Penaeus monodon TaxID=6687 RepID=UPI0018A7892C|nr:acetylcholine receptor subunit alpha-1-A-like [Penaeus monodon]
MRVSGRAGWRLPRKMLLKIVCAVLLVAAKALGDESGETELRAYINKSYDKAALPRPNVTVEIITFKILSFEVNEDAHTMEVHSWLGYSWHDQRLQWKPEDYGGVSSLGMDPSEVWRPDISIYNGVASAHMPESNLPLVLMPDGKIIHIPSVNLKFYCLVDLTYWPHDVHECEIKFGSWVHHGHLLNLDANSTSLEINLNTRTLASGKNITNSEWKISDLAIERKSTVYECCPEPYVSVIISLITTRDAPAYAWVVKTPVICMSFLTLVVFLLPPAAGEKIVFGGLCLVLNVLFLNYSANVIGHAPSHTPLIIQLVCQQMVLVMISVVLSALVVRLARGPHASDLPTFLKRPVLLLASCLCLANYKQIVLKNSDSFASSRKPDELELGEDGGSETRRRENGDACEWLLLAAVVDRLALLLYAAVCVISLIRFSSVL